MSRIKSIQVGDKFGKLTVTDNTVITIRNDNNGKRSYNYKMLCLCDCGNRKAINVKSMLRGDTTSCGCHALDLRTKHKLSRSPLYKVWHSMMERCYKEKSQSYPDYGGRGIKVSEDLHDFVDFYNALINDYKPGLSLDRIDVNGDYTLSNVRWADNTVQSNNRRTTLLVKDPFYSDTIGIAQIAKRYGLPYKLIKSRYATGKRGIDLLNHSKTYYNNQWQQLSASEVNDIYASLDNTTVPIVAKRYNITELDVLIIKHYRGVLKDDIKASSKEYRIPESYKTVVKGNRYGNYTVTDGEFIIKTGKRRTCCVECQCICGTIKVIAVGRLLNGYAVSCGCSTIAYRASLDLTDSNIKRSHLPLYNTWSSMMTRCYNDKSSSYSEYGGRGIAVAEEWHDVYKFNADMLPTWREGLTLDRIDPNGNYSPDNVEWATPDQQDNNKAKTILTKDPFTGDVITISNLAKRYGLSYITVYSRFKDNKDGIDLIYSHFYKHKWPKLTKQQQTSIYETIDNSSTNDAAKLLGLTIVDILMINYHR